MCIICTMISINFENSSWNQSNPLHSNMAKNQWNVVSGKFILIILKSDIFLKKLNHSDDKETNSKNEFISCVIDRIISFPCSLSKTDILHTKYFWALKRFRNEYWFSFNREIYCIVSNENLVYDMQSVSRRNVVTSYPYFVWSE